MFSHLYQRTHLISTKVIIDNFDLFYPIPTYFVVLFIIYVFKTKISYTAILFISSFFYLFTPPLFSCDRWTHSLIIIQITMNYCTNSVKETHLGCLNFVSCTAAPPFEIWQHFTLFPVHAGMHLAPPLLRNYGCCEENKNVTKRREEAIENTLFQSVARPRPGSFGLYIHHRDRRARLLITDR